ncbi:hypothetical protein AAT18_00655 [Rhodococcus aetherivorans]|nr:hypothetical protein AAT18_00655 [Rhodococcus aetherivorans]
MCAPSATMAKKSGASGSVDGCRVFAYVDVQGPDAGCAFDAARERAALHPLSDTRLLGLVEQALEVGLHPTKLRTLSGTGVGIMRRDFGVELPAPGNDCL